MFIYLYLVYVRHFVNHTVVFFGPFLAPLGPSTLGNRLVRLMVAPALHPS